MTRDSSPTDDTGRSAWLIKSPQRLAFGGPLEGCGANVVEPDVHVLPVNAPTHGRAPAVAALYRRPPRHPREAVWTSDVGPGAADRVIATSSTTLSGLRLMDNLCQADDAELTFSHGQVAWGARVRLTSILDVHLLRWQPGSDHGSRASSISRFKYLRTGTVRHLPQQHVCTSQCRRVCGVYG